MGIKINSSDIAATSRATAGVKGMSLKENDIIVSALPIRDENDYIAIFTENGLGKKIKISDLPLQGRAGKGLICYKPTVTTGEVVAGTLIEDSDILLICGKTSSICISAEEVPLLSRVSIGNQFLKNGKVTSVSKV
jgi:DNA gyrase subunit A